MKPVTSALERKRHHKISRPSEFATPVTTIENVLDGGARQRHHDYYRQTIDAEKIFGIICELHESTKTDSPINAPDMVLSTASLGKLLGHQQSDCWVHTDSSGCIIIARTSSENDVAQIYLEGSERAKAVTQVYLETSCKDYNEPRENEQWLSKALKFPPYSDIKTFAPPPVWTIWSFRLYITCLVQQRPRRSAKRFLHNGRTKHVDSTALLLRNAFSDPDSAPFASLQAWRLALRFSRTHANAELFEVVWKAGLILGLRPDISCYNEALGACLLLKKAYKFFELILEMKKASIPTNAHTWQIVLSYTESQTLRLRVLSYLQNAGIIAAATSTEAFALAIVKHDFRPYMDRPGGFARFRAALDHYLGQTWLTTDVLARMLRVCRVRFRDAGSDMASQILCHLQQQGLMHLLNRACFVQLLHLAAKARNLDDALVLVRSKLLQDDPDLQQRSLYLLFHLAWQRQKLNICRLLWFQAALSGKILRAMQNIVKKSLISSFEHTHDQEISVWSARAGQLIIGTNDNSRNLHKLLPLCFPDDAQVSAIGPLLHNAATRDRSELLQLVDLLLERDLNAWRFYHRLGHSAFLHLLAKAEELDAHWTDLDFLVTADVELLLRTRLFINLYERQQPLTAATLSSAGYVPGRPFVVNGHALSYDTLDIAEDLEKVEQEEHGNPHQPLQALVGEEPTPSHDLARVISNTRMPFEPGTSAGHACTAFA